MDKVINCLFAAITLLLSARGEVFKGKQEDYTLEVFVRTRRRLRCNAILCRATARGTQVRVKALKLRLEHDGVWWVRSLFYARRKFEC